MTLGNLHAPSGSTEFHAPAPPAVRLAYVLRHFRLAYAAVPEELSVGYPETHPHLEIADAASGFFQAKAPYPPAPNWREWQGQQIPVFFDLTPEKPLLELLPSNRARIHADLISAAFYLLSGWQEYFSAERDQHGRFPYAASVQQRYGFVAVPVVNYYFDILRTAVEHITGQQALARRWGANAAPFAAFITHDIDNCQSAWKSEGKAALRGGQIARFGRLLVRRLQGRDAWNNLEEVQAETGRWGAKSTFFFLGNPRRAANGTRNADYDLTKPRFQQRIRNLASAGAEVATHGSLGTAQNASQLQQEKAKLPVAALGARFHYLSWEPRQTPQVVAAAGLAYDSTLGFAEHFGFRNSYCLPFHPFDFEYGKAFDFLEIPLNVMDTTLHHPNYLQLAPDEIGPALRPMFEQIERFGGVCTVLWHNENFAPQNQKNGPRQFHELLHYLHGRGAAFVNGTDILNWSGTTTPKS
ncbi:hypothetical protein SAMN00120144_3381 [Hymenobacter roseosalivarius DSM 11622]|uniref:DUF7033 domain-containing protein n=1 Tax=Hymenobacter roseosalivarius DSM 11622 TaxID=645990 RepID=A0A1W1W5R9_9BACT|nr:hypothetical protein [Hymenobacter roseosalivarius]SMC00454.1 hypothetical protein SAMN00120144_3381 [Hymenobacter roseosalivarius DSM 11622]